MAQFLSDKMILIVVTLIGMAMCSMGIGQVAADGDWLNPMTILAYVIGALVLVIVGASLFNIPLPMIDSPRTAVFAVVLLAVVKVAMTRLHHVWG